jgi:hypothetical protein
LPKAALAAGSRRLVSRADCRQPQWVDRAGQHHPQS